MLRDFPLNPILPARDGDRARTYYRDVLGLELLSGPAADPMTFRAGHGTTITVSEMPDRVPPPFPVVSFLVQDIDAVVEGLRGRGAEFVTPAGGRFAGREATKDGDVLDFGPVRTAFLLDPEGNVLALNELR